MSLIKDLDDVQNRDELHIDTYHSLRKWTNHSKRIDNLLSEKFFFFGKLKSSFDSYYQMILMLKSVQASKTRPIGFLCQNWLTLSNVWMLRESMHFPMYELKIKIRLMNIDLIICPTISIMTGNYQQWIGANEFHTLKTGIKKSFSNWTARFSFRKNIIEQIRWFFLERWRTA